MSIAPPGEDCSFDRLKVLLMDEPGPSFAGRDRPELGMTENAVKQAFHRLRVRYREAFARADCPHGCRLPQKSRTSCAI